MYLTKIEKDGAEARALGHNFLQNPYLKSDAMPAATGETIERWQRKHDAWHRGWRMEDLVRDDGQLSGTGRSYEDMLP